MGFRQGLNDWTSILLKLIVIGGIVLIGGYLGLSVYGNLTEEKAAVLPGVSAAPHVFWIVNTGEQLLAKDYDALSEGRYKLHGYYELVDNKWIDRDVDLTLDEFYYGEIRVTRRK
jgi:hypothetical protein